MQSCQSWLHNHPDNESRLWCIRNPHQNQSRLELNFDRSACRLHAVHATACRLHPELSNWSWSELPLIDHVLCSWPFCPLQHVFSIPSFDHSSLLGSKEAYTSSSTKIYCTLKKTRSIANLPTKNPACNFITIISNRDSKMMQGFFMKRKKYLSVNPNLAAWIRF